MDYAILGAALLVSAFTAYTFVRAGLHKLRTADAKLIEAGWNWVKSAPKGTVKFIGVAEVLGGLGVILSPLAVTLFNLDWAYVLGVAAGVGLVTIMVLANIVHIARKEFKYTWKTGLMVLAVTAIATALLVAYPTNI
ncbi:MAG: DoxX family protein [Bacteroidetes bacterium]|nr:DoxX family protein [Microbacteriaceae bacterium]NBS60741.1 DoxX family protein [Microbacteriaceae bacterium]NBT47846.1 DoxX family protein [Actinomycetota bacterium]NBU70337.1 DoxX family protein [Bacteroidota bacterium]